MSQQAPDVQPFLGTWKGICADGKDFVIVHLVRDGAALGGTISMANIQGEEGQCARVVNPPSDAHAMKISNARVKGSAVTFNGVHDTEFELTVAGSGAKLKFLGTPVADNPWTLKRVD